MEVQFINPQDDRMSEIIGPLEWVQITYETMRCPDPDGHGDWEFATQDDGEWICAVDGMRYSDVILRPFTT